MRIKGHGCGDHAPHGDTWRSCSRRNRNRNVGGRNDFFAELYGEVWLSENGLTEIERDLTSMKDRGYKPDKRCFLIRRENRYGQLSNCNRISVFRFQFPDIPRKISAYLRADFTSDANTRKIRGFLYSVDYQWFMFERYFFALQKAPFRLAKWPISGCEMVLFSPWNGLYRTMKWAISECKNRFFGLYYRVSGYAVNTETGFIMTDLTFLYISFAKIFCQNLVKKNRKHVPSVSIKTADIRRLKRHENYAPRSWWNFIVHASVGLSWRE